MITLLKFSKNVKLKLNLIIGEDIIVNFGMLQKVLNGLTGFPKLVVVAICQMKLELNCDPIV